MTSHHDKHTVSGLQFVSGLSLRTRAREKKPVSVDEEPHRKGTQEQTWRLLQLVPATLKYSALLLSNIPSPRTQNDQQPMRVRS